MKKLITVFSSILIASLVLISLNSISSKETNTDNILTSGTSDPDEFLIGAYSVGCASNNSMQELGFNIWHRFLDQYDDTIPGMNQTRFPKGFTPNDKLFDTGYESEVVKYYKESVIPLNNNYIYLTRPKIEMLSFAQRSDYHPFNIGVHVLSSKGNWWYGYTILDRGIDTFDNNKNVRICIQGYQDSGYVLKQLRPTLEQINGDVPNNFFADYNYSWYIKPSVKINPNVNDTTKIFRVEIYRKDSTLFRKIDITRDNFGVNYNGEYKDEFFPSSNNPLFIYDGSDLYGSPSLKDTSYLDYRIFWYGNCDMWIQHVRVENDWAYRLFNNYYLEQGNEWIQWEVQNVAQQVGNKAYKFLIDEAEYNMYPAIGYLNHKIDSLKPQGSKISTIALNNIVFWIPFQRPHWMDTMQVSDVLQNFTNSGMNEIFTDIYPLYADVYSLPNFHQNQYIPNTLPVSGYNVSEGRLGLPYDPQQYEINFNQNIDNYEHHYIDFLNKANMISRERNVPHVAAIQIHSWYNGDETLYSLREPTNEEIEVLAGIAITYGAKGIIYHSYNSEGELGTDKKYSRGLIGNSVDASNHNCDTNKRYINAYGQQKWNFIKDLTVKLKKLGKEIIKFNNTTTHSYRLHNSNESLSLFNNTYLNKIITFKPGSGIPSCNLENDIPDGMTFDCPAERYMQVGTFKSKENENYFMLVNRRAAPVVSGNYSGKRYVRFEIDANSSEFAGFNNWKIIDVENNQGVAVFNKNQLSSIDLSWINPGEIKLYKFAPVMQEGGTFVCDEYVNTNFTCNGMVYGSGHNITINQGKTISFSEDGGLYMEGGCFVSGINSDNADAVTFQGTGGANHWKGITLNGCDSVGIYNTITSNAESNDMPKTYSYSIINTYKVDFRKCNFITENDRGIIQTVYSSSSEIPAILKIRESNFYMENCGYPAINVISNASASIPLIAEWCTFHSKDNDTSCAIMLTGVTGGAVKNCYFYDFGKTIIFISSSIDLYGNLILGGNNSEGLQCLSGSSVSLGPHSGMYLGGYNYFRNYGTTSSNIRTDNSFFDIDCGNNEFDIDETEYSKHLTGTMVSDDEPADVYAYKNCFHEDSITNIEAIHDVIWSGTNSNVNFLFEPYFCDLTQLQDFVVFEAYGFPDTVYYKSGGEGGGFNPNKTVNAEENTYKSLKDTININLRKRNYQTVETNSKLILTQYPDSLESIGMVQKLYMASLNLDSTRIGITKTFLENLISNNTQNPSLIKRAFYFIQKCKVKLGQFQSALEGFQYIMTQNPYTYEGLVASWDYAATYLLMGTGGSYNGNNEQLTEELNTPADTLLSRMSKRDINSAKSTNPNTSTIEQTTKTFYEKIKNITKDDRSKQEQKVKTLEKTLESSKSTTEKNEAARELAVMKQIKEAVKIKKPKTVINHVQIMNDDIKKVFLVGKQSSKESTNSLIPQTYQLYQNYPNPFNPTTKIAFDLPKDAKVKLVIYDILGREMKTLVNNEYRSAGKYITEFNGSNMASGVYFARILVNEGKDFIAVKKLVLLK